MLLPANGSAARYEHTIERPVAASGVGLHYGVAVNLRLAPAAAGQGVVFVRTDLDNFSIRASWRHVARVSFATSLMRQSVLLSTTEHLLSSLRALGVDNVRIEIDQLEVPILDGSALPWADLLRKAGMRKQRRHRRYLRVIRPVEVRDGEKRISIEPAQEFRVVCETRYPHPLVGPQRQELTVTPQAYVEGIAPARTFGFVQDLDLLRDQGLIRGASLENAVCFGTDSVLNEGGPCALRTNRAATSC